MAWYIYFDGDDNDDITQTLAYDYISELIDTTFTLCNNFEQIDDKKFNICFRILTKIVILSKLSDPESGLEELEKLTKELNIDNDLKELIKIKQ
ncbi:hypothetical protein STSV1pORF2 [Sulfolobus virus STSV1]|uniref:hypothetical protein n=1 Tax=Sulfolobus virus STSV1 TaxID=285013 RepID=UPI000042B0F0|nr:hypothetical protein STSV1pORF2 [Sulfolobus virus STSV1]CAH04185.1 hypothetical protein [Sulfolobus virus STSV1]